jgi:hypothetical protein
MKLLIEKMKKNLISSYRLNFDQIFHIFYIRILYSFNISSSTTLLRTFILIKHEINSSRLLLTIITLSLKRQRIAYFLYQKK